MGINDIIKALTLRVSQCYCEILPENHAASMLQIEPFSKLARILKIRHGNFVLHFEMLHQP